MVRGRSRPHRGTQMMMSGQADSAAVAAGTTSPKPFTTRSFVGLVVAFACAVSFAANAGAGLPGEDPLATKDAIGRGVHLFFGGDFDRAYDELTDAIQAGTSDPRAFYYRGLASLRLGRTGEAEADFASGAEHEATAGSTKRVSRALERVQGCDRLTLERFRARARLAGLQRDQEAAARRYSAIEDPSSESRRRRRPEDVGPELLSPRRADGVEEVPPPRGKPGRNFEDEPRPTDGDDPFGEPKPRDAAGDADESEPKMAAEAEEEMAEEDSEEKTGADAEQQ